jgi:hypothetical protein
VRGYSETYSCNCEDLRPRRSLFRFFGPSPLRLQRLVDRIAASSPWLPWVVVSAAAAGYALYFSYYTVFDHRNLGTAAFDLEAMPIS